MSWDGKTYDKYKIEHTDGTPLKGKKYFVLRLDSDDPAETARVAAAMRAYKSEPRNCDRFDGDINRLREACLRERGLNPEEDFPEVFYEWLLSRAKGDAE